MRTKGPIKLVKLDCGKHWGHKSGQCSKCSRPTNRTGLQWDGTPWLAIFEPSQAMSEQDRVASLMRSGLSHLL